MCILSSSSQSVDSQYSVTAVLFHGDNKIASAGAGDGYVELSSAPLMFHWASVSKPHTSAFNVGFHLYAT